LTCTFFSIFLCGVFELPLPLVEKRTKNATKTISKYLFLSTYLPRLELAIWQIYAAFNIFFLQRPLSRKLDAEKACTIFWFALRRAQLSSVAGDAHAAMWAKSKSPAV
jgi:hypothetical protein